MLTIAAEYPLGLLVYPMKRHHYCELGLSTRVRLIIQGLDLRIRLGTPFLLDIGPASNVPFMVVQLVLLEIRTGTGSNSWLNVTRELGVGRQWRESMVS